MADRTAIEWSDATWNIITGCTRVSRGCGGPDGGGCYAERLAATRLWNHPSRAGLTDANGRWSGQVRFNEQWLAQPLRYSRPRKIFACAHSDLFHEAVPDEWIDQVFAVMALSGPRARSMDPAWARSLRNQCICAQVPFFFKQWGGATSKAGGAVLDGREWRQFPDAA